VSQHLDPARTTGLLYLGVAVTGALGHLMLGARLFDPDDPATTLANLAGHGTLARVAVALTLGICLTQALTAVAFSRVFRAVDESVARTLTAFGLVNAVAMLASAALLGAAVRAASAPLTAPADAVQLLHLVDAGLWDVSGLFFGLWLVPMGRLVLRTGPRPLGLLLVGGGALYVLGAFAVALAPGATALATVLSLPATVAELWMIGYLLVRGMPRPTTPADELVAAV
jgi:hypothetical protein